MTVLKSKFKSIKHSTYFEVYDELFSKLRNKKITFVEIGILGGGSLFMWREYFGKKARIIGIDLNPNAKELIPNDCKIYFDWRDMIAFQELDGVIICTPPKTHLEIAQYFIKASVPAI